MEEEYESLSSTLEEDEFYDDYKNELVKYREGRAKVIDLVKKSNYEDAAKIYNLELDVISRSMFEKLNQCIEINQKAAEQAYLNNIAQFNKVRNTIIIYTTVAYLLMILMAYILIKSIINPLNKIKEPNT